MLAVEEVWPCRATVCGMDLIEFGSSLMLAATIGLATVRHMSVTSIIAGYHDALYSDPLAPYSGRVLTRHMSRACATCSFHAELRSSVRIT